MSNEMELAKLMQDSAKGYNETPLMMGDTKQIVMTGVVKVKAYIPEFIEVYAGFLEYVEIDRDKAIEHAKHFKLTAEDLS